MKNLLSQITDLKENSTEYNFFQALYQLEKILEKNKIPLSELVLEPSAELSFPAADIKNIDINTADCMVMQLNFMGFYGVDSPLPQYFFAKLVKEDEHNEKIKKFLNIFNQRIYHLLYLAWKKYHVHVQLEKKFSNYLTYLIAISGNTLNHSDHEEFAFAGLLGTTNHNARNFSYLLSEYLNVKVSVQEFIPTWMSIDNTFVLGTQTILGDNLLLGERMIDFTNKIAIIINCVDAEKVNELMPTKPQGKNLGLLIQRYLGPLIDYDITFMLYNNNTSCLILGKNIITLGWTSIIGERLKLTFKLVINGTVYAKLV